jgi:hypothetical protein
LKTLGDYRFRRVLPETPGTVLVYEYVHGDDPKKRIWAVWSPTGSGKHGLVDLKTEGMKFSSAERMPLSAGEAQAVHPAVGEGKISVEYDESPVFLRWDGDDE